MRRLQLLPWSDEGTVSGYTVVSVAAVLALSGLVLDGGLAVATKVSAVSAAQSAARAGARELDLAFLRSGGGIRLAPAQARAAANGWLTRAGLTGTVSVTGNQVTVAVTTSRRTQLLQLVGIRAIPIDATATATAVQP
jgi:hypothetical protein